MNYRPAKIWKKNKRIEFIFYWRADFNQNFTRFKRTYDINRVTPYSNRLKIANVFLVALNKALANGYNPKLELTEYIENDNNYSLITELHKAFNTIIVRYTKDRTISSYNSHFKYLSNYISTHNYNFCTDFGKSDAIKYQKYLIDKGYSHKTINTKIDFAHLLFKELWKKDLIKENIFEAVDNLKVKESKAHRIISTDEIARIKAHLLVNCPALWQFFLFEFYCFMRPASIMSIQIKDIDIKNKLLNIKGENHKNGKDAYKQLLKPHIDYLVPYLDGIGHNKYLFSDSLSLAPGDKKNYPTRASELWRKYIINELGIDASLYSAKHSGASYFVSKNSNNENIRWLQMQMSHSDLQTTSIYTNKQKIIQLNENNAEITVI